MTIPTYNWFDIREMMADEAFESGWAKLLDQLLIQIDGIVAGTSTKLLLLQVKEKLGSLRFYYRLIGAEPHMYEAIDAAVHQAYETSRVTCFKCGEAGSTRRLNGWIVPTCDAHAAREAFGL